MKLSIMLVEKDQDEVESIVKEWICITDSINRALQMFETDIDGGKMQRLEYKILSEANEQKES